MAVTTVSVPSSPVAVFSPVGPDTSAILRNTGTSTLYLGQSGVTAATGFPLPAGASIQVNWNAALYAVAAVDSIKAPSLQASAPISQGATTITVASGGASFTNGMVIAIIDGNNTELVVGASGSNATTVNISATAKAHATGVTFGQFNGHQGGSIQVSM